MPDWFLNPIDIGAMEAVASTRTAFGDAIFSTITTSGNMAGIWLVVGTLMVIIAKVKPDICQGLFRAGVGVFAALACSQIVIEWTIKPLVDRPRPGAIDAAWNHLNIATINSSFPSGHTGWAFVVVPGLWAWDHRAGKAALAFAVLMGFSRMYVGAHWLSDVVVGAICGLVIGTGVLWASRRVFPASQ